MKQTIGSVSGEKLLGAETLHDATPFLPSKYCVIVYIYMYIHIYQCHTMIPREYGASSNAGFFPTVARGPNPSIRLCSFFGEGFVASLCPQFIYFDTAGRVLALASTYGLAGAIKRTCPFRI